MALQKRSKVVFSSVKELAAAAFTVSNYRAPAYGASNPNNLTFSSDTKQGVLGGSVAQIAGSYLVGQANGTGLPLGLFVDDAQPDAFENAPAIASNKISIAQFGGEFEVDVFETNKYSDNSDLTASLTVGSPVYASCFGLLTPIAPTVSGQNISGGIAYVIGYVTWAPTTSNLILGIDLTPPHQD
jgi:hypothetical protein